MNLLDRNPDGSYRIHIRDNGIVLANGYAANADDAITCLQQLVHRIMAAELHAANEAGR